MSDNDNIPSSEKFGIAPATQDTMNIVFEATKRILDKLEDGKKTTLKDLIDKVVAETKVQVSIANGLVPMYAHSYTGVSVEKGRNGGVFKGGKPKRVDPRPRCPTCGQVDRKKIIKD